MRGPRLIRQQTQHTQHTGGVNVSLLARYRESVQALLDDVYAANHEAIERAAEILCNAIAEDRLVHVFGPGAHSYMGAEEMFYRAGGLACINAILDPGVSMEHGALRTTRIERTPGYAAAVLATYPLQAGDPFIITSSYGINAVSVEAAEYGREKGLWVIAITSASFGKELPVDHPARHPSGKSLPEIAHVTIDNKVPVGDALIEVEGVDERVGPSSTLTTSFCAGLLVLRTVELLRDRGIRPPLWRSANSPGGEEANRRLIEKYRGRIKHL